MWKEAFDGDTEDRMSYGSYAEEDNNSSSRRVSAASDDSFDASCYVHVDNKLNSKMPKSLLNSVENTDIDIQNRFSKLDSDTKNGKVTKNGKRIIRKRLSVSQFKATRLREKNSNNNNNISTNQASNTDTSSSSESDTLPKQNKKEKPSTDVLSAKIQHLLFEMKRLRQLDRDILRKFLVINDTIEEQKWMVEETQEAIKRSLSEEGEDIEAIDVNFDEIEAQVPEEADDDEESIQSVLSRQNSGLEVFDDTLPIDLLGSSISPKQELEIPATTVESDFVSTSSESALSLSGASSTLSSTTSFPASNRSSSPPNSHLSGSSPVSSFVGSIEGKSETNVKTTHPVHAGNGYSCDNDIPDDIEGYYRMYGASIKRGSYPFPQHSNTYDGSHSTAFHNNTYDDTSLDNAYALRRNSYNTHQSNGLPDYAYASRKNIIHRSCSGPVQQQSLHVPYAHARPRSASAAQTDVEDVRNRVQRISVRPDGTREAAAACTGVRRPYSANDKNSAAYRLLQHPIHQKRAMRMNINRYPQNCSFVPIAEQEPDVMCENGRLFSEDSDPGTGRKEYENSMNGHRTIPEYNAKQSRQCPAPRRKPCGNGSAGSLTSSSSRTSSSSLASSGSNSSLHSPTKFLNNETDHRANPRQAAPVWVQRRPNSSQNNEYIAIPYNHSFPAPYSVANYYNVRRKGVHNLPEINRTNSIPQQRQHPIPVKRSTQSLLKSFERNPEPSNVLTVSYKPKNTGTNEAVLNWIQTQDDVTYL